VDNVGVIKKKFKKIYPDTQKLQEISTLDSSPMLIFSQLFLNTLNVNNPHRKEVHELLLKRWKVTCKTFQSLKQINNFKQLKCKFAILITISGLGLSN
jgi:hypothetical protein